MKSTRKRKTAVRTGKDANAKTDFKRLALDSGCAKAQGMATTLQGVTAKRPKYGNTKVVNEHGTFDSKREWRRYIDLMLLQKQGLIKALQRQVKFELVAGVKFTGATRAKPAIRYFADFVYYDEKGNRIVEDAKGNRDDKYIMKKHMMLVFHGIEIREV